MAEREELERLEAQRAAFASDAHLRARAAMWRDASPEERLRAAAEACDAAEELLALKSEAELARVLEPAALPPDTVAILEALQRAARR